MGSVYVCIEASLWTQAVVAFLALGAGSWSQISRNLGNVWEGISLAMNWRMRDGSDGGGNTLLEEHTFICLLWPPGGSSKDGNWGVKGLGHQVMGTLRVSRGFRELKRMALRLRTSQIEVVCWKKVKRGVTERLMAAVWKKFMLGSENDATITVSKWFWGRVTQPLLHMPDKHENKIVRKNKRWLHYLFFNLQFFAQQRLLWAMQMPL